MGLSYLQPALLSSRAYIFPMSPIPIMPMEAFSLLSSMLEQECPNVKSASSVSLSKGQGKFLLGGTIQGKQAVYI